jgi:hypothetical protein
VKRIRLILVIGMLMPLFGIGTRVFADQPVSGSTINGSQPGKQMKVSGVTMHASTFPFPSTSGRIRMQIPLPKVAVLRSPSLRAFSSGESRFTIVDAREKDSGLMANLQNNNSGLLVGTVWELQLRLRNGTAADGSSRAVQIVT